MKTKEKFWNWVMSIKPIHVIVTCVVVFLLFVSAWFPFPFGVPVNWRHITYEVNHRGIFYTTNPLAMLAFPFTGNASAGYLKGADFWSFQVLTDDWAKDKSHVWYEYHPLKGADVATFMVDERGLPKDKYHVFVRGGYTFEYVPSRCGIDPATAEYFVHQHIDFDDRTTKADLYWNDNWMRDSKHVYYRERRMDVDRATFRWLAGKTFFDQAEWYVDKNFVYALVRPENYNYENDSRPPFKLVRADSLRTPLEVIPDFWDERNKPDTIYYASHYLRNGRHILFSDDEICKVVCDVDVKSIRIEDGEIGGPEICVINDTLRLKHGEKMVGKK